MWMSLWANIWQVSSGMAEQAVNRMHMEGITHAAIESKMTEAIKGILLNY
jgi:hypothetical protein